MSRPPTFAIETLGCKVNQYDSAAMAAQLVAMGLRQVPPQEAADVRIVDTCTVTAIADRKSRKLVRRAARLSPQSLVVVTGCAAEGNKEAFGRLKGVRIVTGNREKEDLPRLVLGALGQCESPSPLGHADCLPAAFGPASFGSLDSPGPRQPLKIQDGCDNGCSYCIVPSVRGRPRSKSVAEVVAEAQRMVASGVREVVLTGVRLGAYGQDRADGASLAALLPALDRVSGLARVRLSSISPGDVTGDLVHAAFACPKVCRHWHLCLQSGSDRILALMRRGYTAQSVMALADHLRAHDPGVALTADVIVGFPGETEDEFGATVEVLFHLSPSRLHVFKYSPRPGTQAAMLPDRLPAPILDERSQSLIAVGHELAGAFAQSYIGRTVLVLVEKVDERGERAEGLTDTYVRTRLNSGAFARGEMVRALVGGRRGTILLATKEKT